MKKNIIKICVGIMLISILILINGAASIGNMAITGEESITGNISPTDTKKIGSTTIPTISPTITNVAETTEKEQPATEKTTKASPGFGYIISILIMLVVYVFRNKMIRS